MLILQKHLTFVTTINTREKKPLTGLPGSCFCTASRAPFPSGGSAPAEARLPLTPGAAFKAAHGEEKGSRMTGS